MTHPGPIRQPAVPFQAVSFILHCDHLAYMQRDKNSRLATTTICPQCMTKYEVVEPFGPGKSIEVRAS